MQDKYDLEQEGPAEIQFISWANPILNRRISQILRGRSSSNPALPG